VWAQRAGKRRFWESGSQWRPALTQPGLITHSRSAPPAD
jgi:hypothetical protein